MADPWTIGLGIASVGASLLGGNEAEQAAKDAAQAQIDVTRRQSAEQRRQMERNRRAEYGAGRAAIGASNIQFSGSAASYLRELDMENMREIAFHRQTQRENERAIWEGAQGVGDAYKWQAAGDAIGYAARAFAGSFNRQPTGTLSDISVNRGAHAMAAPRLTMAAGMSYGQTT